MSFSPALAHRQRVLAAIATGTATAANALPEIDDANPAAAEYRQLLSSLHNDLRALHDVQSVQEKIARKATLIATYLPWVTGAISAGAATDDGPGSAVQDEIVSTMLVWHLDLCAWSEALLIADHMLRHGVSLPERYKRDVATLLVDRIADTAKEDAAAVPSDVLTAALDLTNGYDMPDQARAKLHRAIGLDLMAQAETFDPAAETAAAGGRPALVSAALTSLRHALKFDQRVGVKKQIEQLEREEKKLAEAANAEAAKAQE